MIIYFNGIFPENINSYAGVVNDNDSNTIEFVIKRHPNELLDLARYTPYLKVEHKETSFYDKTGALNVSQSDDDLNLIIRYFVPRKVSRKREVLMQLQFENAEDANVKVWQTAVIKIRFAISINADKEIAAQGPEILQEHAHRLTSLENTAINLGSQIENEKAERKEDITDVKNSQITGINLEGVVLNKENNIVNINIIAIDGGDIVE
jgi:hypothetical protein